MEGGLRVKGIDRVYTKLSKLMKSEKNLGSRGSLWYNEDVALERAESRAKAEAYGKALEIIREVFPEAKEVY